MELHFNYNLHEIPSSLTYKVNEGASPWVLYNLY